MDQKWIQVLVILLFCHKFISAGNTIEEGKEAQVVCDPIEGSLIIWFRVVDGSNMEFIASFSSNGFPKSKIDNFDTLFRVSNSGKTLVVKSFDKKKDSGIYSCASLVGGNKLTFGRVTRLAGETKPVTPPPRQNPTQTSTTAKSCPVQVTPDLFMFCNPLILGSLAGGCGLLLLLLIVTILYCNKIRTRRCPHHYKRRPKTDALDKQMNNRHI